MGYHELRIYIYTQLYQNIPLITSVLYCHVKYRKEYSKIIVPNLFYSGAGCGENHAHPDTSMKLCPNIHYCELFENFSLANPN